MSTISFTPAPMVKVGTLDVIALSVELGDPDIPAMLQARNGKPLVTDRVLLGLRDDRARFIVAVMEADINATPEWPIFDAQLQVLYADLQAKTANIPAIDDTPTEPPWPEPLGGEAYYGLAGDIVRTIDPHTEADPAGVLVQFLVAFGSSVGRGPRAVVERTRHGVNEFCCLVGDTAKARKGTSVGHIIDLFRAVELRQDPLQQATAGSWVGTRVKNGLATGEGLIWNVRDPIEKTEATKEKGKITGYQRVVVDEGEADKRLLVLEGELAATLKVLSREGNTLSPALRNAWDGTRLAIMTKNFPACATDAHISIIGHITKTELRREMAEVEGANGFANRFLWCCVKRSKELPDGGTLTDADLAPLVARLDQALTFAQQDLLLWRDEDARQLWHAVYHDLSEGKEGLFGAVTARAEAHVLRLSCLYALLDLSPVVRQEHLLAALTLWRYCEESAGCIFGGMSGNPIADKIDKSLQAADQHGMTRTDINKLFSGNVSKAKIQTALDELLKAGKATREHEMPDGGKGRMVETWFTVRAPVEHAA